MVSLSLASWSVMVRLGPFGSWLTLVFGAKMAKITLDAFNLYAGRDELNIQPCSAKNRYTHGSVLSHLSFDALHREHDKVNLRTLDSESGGLTMLDSRITRILEARTSQLKALITIGVAFKCSREGQISLGIVAIYDTIGSIGL